MLQRQPRLFLAVFPIFLVAICFEALWITCWKRQRYPWRESLTSFTFAVAQRFVAGGLLFSLPMAASRYVWGHRIATVPMDSAWDFVALFIGLEFFYYWEHRASHAMRWLWATHSVHHSPEHLNFSAAYRLGVTNVLSGVWLFFLPMRWLGFSPLHMSAALGINLLYQFWLHTELVPKLGFLEGFLDTPSNHRVHHSSNHEYLDKNFGGVLVIFDRLFGTYAAERKDLPCRYGLVGRKPELNPVKIAFREWILLVRDLKRASTFGERLRTAFGPPGASPSSVRRIEVERIRADLGNHRSLGLREDPGAHA